MKIRTQTWTAAPLIAAMLAGSAAAQDTRERQDRGPGQAQPARQAEQRQDQRSAQLVLMTSGKASGAKIVNRAGKELGSINDLIVDLRRGETPYAVVTFGGFLGIGSEAVAVPIRAFGWDQAEERFILDVTEEQLKQAPKFDKDNWDDLHDEGWLEQVQRAFQRLPGIDDEQRERDGEGIRDRDRQRQQTDRRDREQDRRDADRRDREQDRRDRDRRAEREEAETDRFDRYMMAKDLRGADVTGNDNERLGTIAETVFDRRTGHVAFTTVAAGGVMGIGATTRLVPWEALKRTDERRFSVDIGSARFENAPAFREDDLARLNREQARASIYAFYGVEPRQMRGEPRTPDRWEEPGRETGWAPGSEYNRKFAQGEQTQFEGSVVSADRRPPMRGMSEALILRVRAEDGEHIVHVGPAWFTEREDFSISRGATVRVEGRRAEIDGREVVLASVIRTDDSEMRLRDDDGTPRWSTRGR